MKRHIIKVGYYSFATESLTKATRLIELLSGMELSEYDYRDHKVYRPVPEKDFDIKLECNQAFEGLERRKPRKPLSLPAPKRGSILCICEKSYVAPRQSCPHCGRAFAESHSRTHDGTSRSSDLPLL